MNVLDLCLVLDEDLSANMKIDHELHDYGIVPSSTNVQFIEELRRRGSGKARLHVRM